MTSSPRQIKTPAATTHATKPPQSATMLLLATALDTSLRAFIPTIGGTFLGIGIDHQFGIAPVGTIVCLIAGTALSILLILKQLRDARKPL